MWLPSIGSRAWWKTIHNLPFVYFWRHNFKFQIYVAAKERPHHENLGLMPSARPSKQRVTSGNRLEGQGYHLRPVMHTWLALQARRVSITSHM
jgi:hypothetical protein